MGQTLAVGEPGILLLSFVVGSVPTSNLLARAWRGVDLREFGGGTVGGTALYRVAGWWALVVAGLVDIVKGALGPLLARSDLLSGTNRPVLAAFAGGAAVLGHNWSPFLRGAGGRGIAPAIGALLVNAWPGVVLLLGIVTIGRGLRHTAVFALLAELALTPVLAIISGEAALAGAAIATPMVVKRVLGNSRPRTDRGRVYVHRLLFDRDPLDRDAAPGVP